MEAARYLERLDVDPATVSEPSLEELARLQRAHVSAVPFENLGIVGHPDADRPGPGVTLEHAALYEKIVRAERGGFCYELNGLFNWLLDALGFNVDRVVGAVLQDGQPVPPANHLTSVVRLDRPYVVDVGLGVPPMRQPTPLDGTARRDEAGVAWRVVESDRPDAAYLTQYRIGEDSWSDRYVFRTDPRPLSYVEATCEYLTSAPESPFTGDPVVSIATPRGYSKLTRDTLERLVDGTLETMDVDSAEWHDHLRSIFGLDPAAL